jgi:IS605 OrfB family transposase
MSAVESTKTEDIVLDKKTVPISRCFKGKICEPIVTESDILSGVEALAVLRATHEDFNQAVRRVIIAIQEATRPDSDPRMRELLTWLKEQNANSAHNILEPMTIPNLKTDRPAFSQTGRPELANYLGSLSEEGKLLLDVNKEFPWFRTALRRKIFQKAMEKIKAHENLYLLWRKGDMKEDGSSVDLEKNVEASYKRLQKILKNYGDILDEKRDSDVWTDKLLEGFNANKGKKGVPWLKAFLQEALENPFNLSAVFEEYGTGEIGKEDWLIKQRKWKERNVAFIKIFEDFFLRLEQDDIGPFGIIDIWGREGKLGSSYQSEYEQNGFQGVLSRLGIKKPGLGHGETVRENYQRGHRLLVALQACGETLVKWRNSEATYVELPEGLGEGLSEQERRKKQWEYLKEHNPEIRSLLKFQQDYQAKYREFKRAPGKRLPDPVKHPEWIDFQKDSGYKNLDFETQTVSLMVRINPEEVDPTLFQYDWRRFYFGLDRRFVHLTPQTITKVGKKIDPETGEVQTKQLTLYRWHDPKTNESAHIDVKGIKLLLRRQKPELVFRYEYDKQLFKSVKQDGRTREGTRTLNIDFGQKHVAALTCYEQTGDGAEPITFRPAYLSHRKKHANTTKPVRAQMLEIPGLSFKAVDQIQKEIAAKTRKMTRSNAPQGQRLARFIVRGTVNHARLRSHYTRIKDERVKKAASAILQTALNLREGDLSRQIVIVHENLTSYKTNLKHERHENRRLQLWSVQRIIHYLEGMAEPYGIMLVGKSPAYTSQVCSYCNHWGVRFNEPSQKDWVKGKYKRIREALAKEQGVTLPERQKGDTEKDYYQRLKAAGLPRRAVVMAGGDFFCCSNPDCSGISPEKRKGGNDRYTVNADINASRNLGRKFHDNVDLTRQVPSDKEGRQRISAEIQAYLNQIHSPKVIRD